MKSSIACRATATAPPPPSTGRRARSTRPRWSCARYRPTQRCAPCSGMLSALRPSRLAGATPSRPGRAATGRACLRLTRRCRCRRRTRCRGAPRTQATASDLRRTRRCAAVCAYGVRRPVPAHAPCTCTLHMHPAHAHCTCTLHMHTAHAHCTCTLHMHTAHAHCTCTLHMHTAHAHCTCTLHMHTAHAHCTCASTSRHSSPQLELVGGASPHYGLSLHGYSLRTGGGRRVGGREGGREFGNTRCASGPLPPLPACATDMRSARGACADVPALARSKPRQEQAHQLQHGGVLRPRQSPPHGCGGLARRQLLPGNAIHPARHAHLGSPCHLTCRLIRSSDSR